MTGCYVWLCRYWRRKMERGYFGIGVENLKFEVNLGTLWRSAFAMGASFTFTIGKRMVKQSSDTTKAWRHLPHYTYTTVEELITPYDAKVVGIEITDEAIPLVRYRHPTRAIYILGAEDNGITDKTMSRCHDIVKIPSSICLNVAVAGSIVMYDRIMKGGLL
jgi:tRNA G18 (ribose-2'-O)-methylase SpoU